MELKEKVIKGLECCAHEEIGDCDNCPYNENTPHCDIAMMRDAIALLKAQEQEIEDLKQEIEGHKDNLRETLDEMMRYADELKAQEPVEPKIVDTSNSKLYHNDMFKNHYCGNCGEFLHVVNRRDMFCSQCGRKVKWE